MRDKTIQTDFYVTFTPYFGRRIFAGEDPRIERTEAKLTKTRPRGSETRGAVVVKFRVGLPEAAFLPLAPEVIVDVPIENAETVHVTVLPPDQPKDDDNA